jgi:peptide/nickel transport system permease protein
LAAFVEENGLDRSVVVRYLDWLWDALRGDWGTTLATKLPVQELVIPAFVRTAELAALALLWSLPVAILLGMVMARRKGIVDMTLLVGMVMVAALPEFVIAIGVLLIFAVRLQWLPVDAAALQFGSGIDVFLAYVPAALTLGIAFIPYVSRITRASVAESLAAPYTRGAVLRGLPRRRVVWGHAMRTASVPLVNAISLVMIYAMGGVIVVENVFGFPGLGRLLVQSITQGDTNVVLIIVMLLGTLFILLALIADLLVVRLNPKLKAVS